MKRILISLVVYKNIDLSINYIQSVKNSNIFKNIYYKLVFLDNYIYTDSDEKKYVIDKLKLINIKPKEIDEKYDDTDIEYYFSDKNYGYALGNNLIFNKYLNTKFDYFLVSNNDIIFDNNYKTTLNEVLMRNVNQNIGLIGLDIIEKNKSIGPLRYESIWERYILLSLFPINIILKIINEYYFKNKTKSIRYVYGIPGCFMIFKKDVFIKICGFDENTFLYSEEYIIAEKLKKNKINTIYIPLIKIYHLRSTTISNYLDEKKRQVLKFSSDMYYYKKYLNKNDIEISLAKFSHNYYINIVLPFILKINKYIGRLKKV